jgi:hypothetical protein
MPCVGDQRPHLASEGPTISVLVRPSSAFLSASKEQGRDVEEVPAVRALMLVDTGASGSAVDHEVTERLGVQPTGAISIATPSHDHHEVLTYDIDRMIEQNQCHLADVPCVRDWIEKAGDPGTLRPRCAPAHAARL